MGRQPTGIRAAVASSPPAAWFSSPAWRTATGLAWIEGWRLLRHPAFLAGLILSALMFVANVAGSPWPADAYSVLIGTGVGTIGPFAMLTTNAATLRGRRHRTGELDASLPTVAGVRTAAHLATAVWAGGVAGLATVGAVVCYHQAHVFLARPPSLAELAQGPAAVGCAAVLGVVLARWTPSLTMAGVALGATVTWMLAIGSAAGQTAWFAPLVDPQLVDHSGQVVGFRAGSVGWHLAWLAGLAALGAVVALLRDGVRRSLVALGIGAVVLLAVAGLLQVH